MLFDAAHQCGIIAGGAWPNPLAEGAHLMTMSTYKSLGGPAGGLIVTNDAEIAERLDHIAFPGMTANFDAAKSAALAHHPARLARPRRAPTRQTMVAVAPGAGGRAGGRGPAGLRQRRAGFTRSHQFAIEAAGFGGGQAASKTLRQAGVPCLRHRPADADGRRAT